MLIYRKNPETVPEICRDAPRVGAPYVVGDKNKPNKFNENDAALNQIVGGYSSGPSKSYAKDLLSRFPLHNE